MTDRPTPHQLVAAVCDLLDADELPDEMVTRLGEALGRRTARRIEAAGKKLAAAITEAGAAFQQAMAKKPEVADD